MNVTAQDLFEQLCAPFPTEVIDWRIGAANKEKTKGMALCYVDARVVMDRLDAVCGVDGWQCNYTPAGTTMICNLGIRIGAEWIWKADGAGQTDFEAEKGGLSDAFKRSAARWGIGRFLYDVGTPWVELIEERGKHVISDAGKTKLNEVYEKAAQRVGWGNPAEIAVYKLLLREVQETVKQPADVLAFRERHKGMIPSLRVAMRHHLNGQLDRIGGKAA